jgi:hypothetical protein
MYAKTRSQFTSADYAFIAETLAPDERSRDAILQITDDTPSVTELLHSRRLFDRTMTTPPAFLPVSPHLFFYTFVYQALEKRRLGDDVVDYVAAVCVEFRSSGALWHFAGEGKTLYLVDMLGALAEADATQRYYLQRHIGNAALFLTGFFPDFLFRRSRDRSAPPLAYYESVGRSQYGSAADATLPYEEDAGPVLAALAERFVDVRCAINVFTDAYLNLAHGGRTIEVLQRQVKTLDEEGLRDSLAH